MKKLSKDQIARLQKLTEQLQEAQDDLDNAVGDYNERLQELVGDVESAVNSYNEVVRALNKLQREVYDEDHSEKSAWMSAWKYGIDEVDLPSPDDLEMPSEVTDNAASVDAYVTSSKEV